jgi:signal peptidase I
MEPPLSPRYDRPGTGSSARSGELYELLQSFVLLLIFIILVFTFLGRVTEVVGISMVPTLRDGDRLWVSGMGYHPARGDVVVLTRFDFMDEALVKRVIAVGGQTVDIDYARGTVSVDGVVLDEPYINGRMLEPGYNNISSITVPEGSVFVMGDNRNESMDSRYVELSVVDERCILGHAVMVLFPLNRIGIVK